MSHIIKNEIRNIILSSIICLTILLFGIWCFYISKERERQIMREGQVLIERIDDYIKTNKKVPESLREIGIDDSAVDFPFYYSKLDSIYSLTIVQDFHDPFECGKTYYSNSKKWKY